MPCAYPSFTHRSLPGTTRNYIEFPKIFKYSALEIKVTGEVTLELSFETGPQKSRYVRQHPAQSHADHFCCIAQSLLRSGTLSLLSRLEPKG